MLKKYTILYVCISSLINIIVLNAQDFIPPFRNNTIIELLKLENKNHLIKNIIILSDTYKNYPDSASFTYDDKGNILSEKYINRYSVGAGQAEYSKTAYYYSYDTDGKLLTGNCQYFNGSEWLNDYKVTYIYNENNLPVSELKEIWLNNDWIEHSNIIYTYNNLNLLESDLMLKWKNNSWENDFKRTYQYDSLGNINNFLREIWLNGIWVNSYKTTYSYDYRKNMLTSLGETWDDSLWLNSFSLIFSYDSSNNTTSREEKRWKKSDLIYHDSVAFIYDSNNNIVYHSIDIQVDYIYNNTGFFVNTFEYIYGSTGNILFKISRKYNALGLNLQLLDSYKYDEDGFLTEGLYEAWDGEKWQISDRLNLAINISDSHRKKTFLSSHCFKFIVNYFLSMDAEEPSYGNLPIISCIPNPVSEILDVRVNKFILNPYSLGIYDSRGNKVYSYNDILPGKHSGHFRINVNEFPQGIYSLVLNSSEIVYHEKIIILK